MNLYDEIPGQFRPRAPLWRLCVTSLCQFVIAALLANALATVYETWMFVRAGVTPIAVEVTPWSTTFTHLAVRSGDEYGERFFGNPIAPQDEKRAGAAIDVQSAHMDHNAFAVAALLALACVVLFLWPVRPWLGARLFVHVVAQMLVVGAFLLVTHEPLYVTGLWYEMPGASMFAGLLALTIPPLLIIIERRAISMLANVYAMERLRVRLAIWFLRIVIPVALLGAAAHFAAPNREIARWAFGTLLVSTLLAAFPRPRERFEQLTDPDLRRGFGARVALAGVLVVASIAVFGINEKRVVVITARGVKVQPWKDLEWKTLTRPSATLSHSRGRGGSR